MVTTDFRMMPITKEQRAPEMKKKEGPLWKPFAFLVGVSRASCNCRFNHELFYFFVRAGTRTCSFPIAAHVALERPCKPGGKFQIVPDDSRRNPVQRDSSSIQKFPQRTRDRSERHRRWNQLAVSRAIDQVRAPAPLQNADKDWKRSRRSCSYKEQLAKGRQVNAMATAPQWGLTKEFGPRKAEFHLVPFGKDALRKKGSRAGRGRAQAR